MHLSGWIQKMIVRFSKNYKKQYKKLTPKLQKQTRLRIELWQEDPGNAILRHHELKGRLKGSYSINITGDVRAIYEIIDGEMYLYQMIGTHSQLYK